MNLNNLVRGPIGAVNPNVLGTWRKSTGYATADTGKRSPTYRDMGCVTIQEQALSADELKQLDSLNIQGIRRAFWIDGDVEGVDRTVTPGKGGDIIVVPSGTYLIVQVFETWTQGGWCHCAGQRQQAAAP